MSGSVVAGSCYSPAAYISDVEARFLYLIAGLGNPGKVYEATRHNAGFLLVDWFAEAHNIRFKKSGLSQWAEAVISGADVVIVKPQTFMNRSGEAVAELRERYGVPIESILVAYDDCDLLPGRIRVRKGGSTGGHRGIESLGSCVGGTEFIRIRLGVGRPASGEESLADYVLTPFGDGELKTLNDMLGRGAACIETILTDGVEAAMNRFNSVAASS